MKGFRSIDGVQRLLAAFGGTSPHFRPRCPRFQSLCLPGEITTRFTTGNEEDGLGGSARGCSALPARPGTLAHRPLTEDAVVQASRVLSETNWENMLTDRRKTQAGRQFSHDHW
jgi:hypothetical protein